MRKCDVRTPEQALAYLTDCTLATVCGMAMQKRRAKGEYQRQISMAQAGCDWLFGMKADYAGTRVEEVANYGSVAEWAKQFEVDK